MSIITCQGQTINCTSLPTLAELIDPDIAGDGVIAAFIFTGVATLFTLYAGYITDSLDKVELNAIDLKARNILRRLLFLKPLPQEQDSIIQKTVRSEAILRFILAFSDQQLVTGLAVLIASFAKRCTITVFTFKIATAMAWFSSVTHLATLSILRRYFIDRPRILHIRLVGMVAVLGLLLSAELIPAVVSLKFTERLMCTISLGSEYSSFSLTDRVTDILIGVWVFLYFGIAYGNRIISLICEDPQLTALGWVLQKLRKVFGVPATTRYEGRAKKTLLSIHSPEKRNLYARTRDIFSMVGFFFNELLNSFLWQLMFTTFGITYGLLEVVMTRWPYFMGTTPDPTDMSGFGQIVPLLLLFLPVLAAIEVYEDVRVLNANALATPSAANSSRSDLYASHRLNTASSPTTQTPGFVPVASVPATFPLPNETSRSEGHTTTSEVEEPQQTTLSRNRGTERSIGIELEHVKPSRRWSPATGNSHGASNTHPALTKKDYNEIYSLGYANSTIVFFVLSSTIASAVFVLALSSWGTLNDFLEAPQVIILSTGLTFAAQVVGKFGKKKDS
ncbi:hypothetical protein MMC27_005327 [Xylographa pallens]|nr:hypothetical protein [Xylographa pallens]